MSESGGRKKSWGTNKTLGALMFGAAVLSLFAPARRTAAVSTGSPPVPAEPPKPVRRAQPRLYALVQTRPHVIVLAVSTDRAELEREMTELDETVNHRALRSERHDYEIQAVPVLVRTPTPTISATISAGPGAQARGADRTAG